MTQIKNTRALRRAIANGQEEYAIQLRYGAFSRKTIWSARKGRFHVFNHIDETEQTLTGRELYSFSNIGLAMRQGAFWAEPSPTADY